MLPDTRAPFEAVIHSMKRPEYTIKMCPRGQYNIRPAAEVAFCSGREESPSLWIEGQEGVAALMDELPIDFQAEDRTVN